MAEKIAIDQGIATKPSYYAFRDHFIIVGPPSNPANISAKQDILTLFTYLYTAAEAGNTSPPVRFLSRFDKSATNIKEAFLWISIGQASSAFFCVFRFTRIVNPTNLASASQEIGRKQSHKQTSTQKRTTQLSLHKAVQHSKQPSQKLTD